MKCTVCDGRGFFPVSNIATKICPQCNGTGEVQMTEQEYIQTCDTEQLAEFLYDIAYFDNWSDAIMNDSLINETAVEDAIEKWLKQPHTVKE